MLKIRNVQKSFGDHHVLKGVNLDIAKGEFVAIIGASGCGKTTLIRTINGFIVPDAGTVELEGETIEYKNQKQLRRIRKKVGMIYQLFNLVERTSAKHNVLCGALGKIQGNRTLWKSLLGFFGKDNNAKAIELLKFVGMEERQHARADKLSGGQKQRVAIARALMQDPHLLLADEPIANLDPKTAKMIVELLKQINELRQLTVITVIHHIEVVKDYFSRVIAMKDGVVVYDGTVSGLSKDLLHTIYSAEAEEKEACTAA
jgi:phosphonate transport system ATP-binding protein